MPQFSFNDVVQHWSGTRRAFRGSYRDWTAVFDDVLREASAVADTLQGRRALAENCSYLLLAKALNHSLSSYALLERGMLIDSALCARNAAETMLLLQACLLDPDERLFDDWSNGKVFRPAWVREQLERSTEVAVRDVVFSVPAEAVDTKRFVYRWLSEITHANLGSIRYLLHQEDSGRYVIHVGGSIRPADPFVNAIFAVLSHELLETSAFCAAVLSLEYLEVNRERHAELGRRIAAASKSIVAKAAQQSLAGDEPASIFS